MMSQSKHRRRVEWDPFKIMIAVIVFGSALYLAWFSYENRQVASCQAKFNADVAQVTRARATIASEERQAQVDFFLNLAQTRDNQPAARRIFENYIERVKIFEQRRRQNPLPNLEERSC